MENKKENINPPLPPKDNYTKNKKLKIAICILIMVIVGYLIIKPTIAVIYKNIHVICEKSPEICKVKINEPFILLSSYNSSGRIIGGCFLGEINYNDTYLRKIDSIKIKWPIDYIFGSNEEFHRFLPIKRGQINVNTTGFCSYEGSYIISIE